MKGVLLRLAVWLGLVVIWIEIVIPRRDALVGWIVPEESRAAAGVVLILGFGLIVAISTFILYRSIRRRIAQADNPLIRALVWMRNLHDSERARQHYIKYGVMSSRIYAVGIPIMIFFMMWLAEMGISDSTLTQTALVLCIVPLITYLWYQAKQPIAHDVVRPDDAMRDLLNSLWPLVSLVSLFILWAFINIAHLKYGLEFALSFTGYGWWVFGSAAFAVFYDLNINSKITFILSTIPPRAEIKK